MTEQSFVPSKETLEIWRAQRRGLALPVLVVAFVVLVVCALLIGPVDVLGLVLLVLLILSPLLALLVKRGSNTAHKKAPLGVCFAELGQAWCLGRTASAMRDRLGSVDPVPRGVLVGYVRVAANGFGFYPGVKVPLRPIVLLWEDVERIEIGRPPYAVIGAAVAVTTKTSGTLHVLTRSPNALRAAIAKCLSEFESSSARRELTPQIMDETQFWDLIDVHESAPGDVPRPFPPTAVLGVYGSRELAALCRRIDWALDQLNSWELWAVAYLAMGGCSDDDFLDFRYWVIACGRQAFEMAVVDPLAFGLSDKFGFADDWANSLLSLAPEVYRMLTGQVLLPRETVPPIKGEPWSESEIEDRYPELSQKFNIADG